jgi:hypothetical protein
MSRLPPLLALLGALILFGMLVRPRAAVAPTTPHNPSAVSASSAPLLPPQGTPSTSQRLLKVAHDCVYTIEMERAQRIIQELSRTTRSGEQLEVESREAVERARRYAERVGSGIASPYGEASWIIVADGVPVILVNESTDAVTNFEGQALCPPA